MNNAFLISSTSYTTDSIIRNWTDTLYKWWCCFALLLLISSNAKAGFVSWTSNGDHVSWSDPLNWSTGQLPTASDTASVANWPNITINTGENYTIKYLTMGGTLTIQSGASLTVDGSDYYGIRCNGQINNYGTLTVKNCVWDGIYNWSLGTPKKIENHGTLYIKENIGRSAVLSTETAPFVNHVGGYIELDDYVDNGIKYGVFQNYGTLLMPLDNGNPGILITQAGSSFTNEACGKTFIQNKLEIALGQWNNYGFFSQDYDGFNSTSATTTKNYGVVEEIQYSFNQLDNDKIKVRPYANQTYEGLKANPISIYDLTGFSLSDMYTTHDLITSAGPFNNTTYEWIPNGAAVGETIFFVEITDSTNGCKDTAMLTLDLPVIGTNYWLSGNGLWHNPVKWSKGTVPVAGEITIIQNPNSMVSISADSTARFTTLYLSGKLTNKANGTIEIMGDDDNIAFQVDGGTLTNQGNVSIDNSKTGVSLTDGDFNNNGTFQIKNTLFGISQSSSNLNNPMVLNNGNLKISHANIAIYGPVVNMTAGSILIDTISNVGMSTNSSDTITNHGLIRITGDGIGIGINAEIQNLSTGTIQTENLAKGLDYSGNNFGMISIEDCVTGIDVNFNFYNKSNAIISIENCNTAIYNYEKYMQNEADAELLINSCQVGISISSSSFFGDPATIDNYGLILIDSSTTNAISLGERIYNYSGGIILINQSSGNGISSPTTDGGSFYNEGGKLRITNCDNDGIFFEVGTFRNDEGGEVEIDSIGGNGIYLSGILYNHDQIWIGDQVQGKSIQSTGLGSIHNYGCLGQIIVEAPIDIQTYLENTGIIDLRSNDVNSINSQFYNLGLIIDPFGTLSPADYTENGFYITEVTGNYSEGDQVTNAIVDSSSVSTLLSFGSIWYLNPNLTQSAGTYDDVQNIFIPNADAVGDSIFYCEVSSLAGCSTAIIQIVFTNTIKVACGTNVWQGGTGQWQSNSSWSLGRLPNSCDVTQILGVSDSVVISNNLPITIKKLQNAGFLKINASSVLIVANSTINGLDNSGKILNIGSLSILDAANHGIKNMTGSEFMNQGILNIQNVTSRGIDQSQGLFSNTGSITISGCGNAEIYLRSLADFQSNGSILVLE